MPGLQGFQNPLFWDRLCAHAVGPIQHWKGQLGGSFLKHATLMCTPSEELVHMAAQSIRAQVCLGWGGQGWGAASAEHAEWQGEGVRVGLAASPASPRTPSAAAQAHGMLSRVCSAPTWHTAAPIARSAAMQPMLEPHMHPERPHGRRCICPCSEQGVP